MARRLLFSISLLTLTFAFALPSQALHIGTVQIHRSVDSGADLKAAFGNGAIRMAMRSINLERKDVFSLASKLIPASDLGLKGKRWAKIHLEDGQIATLNMKHNRVALHIKPRTGNVSYARIRNLESVRIWDAGSRPYGQGGGGSTAPVPEPISAVVFGVGLLLVGATIRRSA